MIDERPDGADLLEVARALFESDVLPELGKSRRHAARMILRAMDLALREMKAGTQPLVDEVARLRSLMSEGAPHDAQSGSHAHEAAASTSIDAEIEALKAQREALDRRLIERMRRGELDPGTADHDAVLAHLQAVARDRVSRSNPRRLNAKR